MYTICYLFMQKNSFLIAYSFCSLTSDETYMMCPEYWLRLAPHANTYLYEIPTTRGSGSLDLGVADGVVGRLSLGEMAGHDGTPDHSRALDSSLCCRPRESRCLPHPKLLRIQRQ